MKSPDGSRDLLRACAEFYLLESTATEGRFVVDYVSGPSSPRALNGNGFFTTRSGSVLAPAGYGSGSRLERISLEANILFAQHSSALAEELADYISQAVGGELRHYERICREQYGEGVCYHNHDASCWAHTPECCSGNLLAYALPINGATGRYIIQPLPGHTWHHESECVIPSQWDKYAPSGPFPLLTIKCYLPSHVDHGDYDGADCNTENCSQTATHLICAHECDDYHSGCSIAEKPDYDYDIPAVLREFTNLGDEGRDAVWQEWARACESPEREIELLAAAADCFEHGGWDHSYGGSLWAVAARLVLAYRKGEIKPSVFVDRCWALQHNSGPLFDKVYSTLDLYNVLEIQKCNQYDKLTRWACVEVGSLWNQRRRALASMRPLR